MEQQLPSLTLPETDVDEILRRKRKARSGQKSCYPCRQRKVKCDHTVPCRTCVEREHPELCSYHPPSTTIPRLSSSGGASKVEQGEGLHGRSNNAWAVSREDWNEMCSRLDAIQDSLSELRENMRQSRPSKRRRMYEANGSDDEENQFTSASDRQDVTGNTPDPAIIANNDLMGDDDNVYLGGNSVPAMVVAMGKGDDGQLVQDLLGKSVLPVFALDNDTATYPFVDLWGLPHGSIERIRQLCNLLPSDSECFQYFSHYRETAHVLYPGISDVGGFESDLLDFLANRRNGIINSDGNNIATQKAYGKDLHWIGLLFAALASGCQCSGRARKERQLMSQVFVCCAYECLRIVNYLSHSTMEDVQNLLVIGNVISNNHNAGVAWSLLGLTSRLAQSQGLHREPPASVPPGMRALRTHVWWQIIWQDSLLSITYDRASSTAKLETVLPPTLPGTKLTYIAFMRGLCKTGLDIIHQRQIQRDLHHELLRMVQTREKLQELLSSAADHLRDNSKCKSIRDQLEYWNLYLHRSYIASELCRPTLQKRRNSDQHSAGISSSLRKTCIESLADTVEAFIGLQNVTQFASQSWAAVHRSLSSALLLGILREPTRNERVRNLLTKLVSVMSSINSGMDPSEYSAPITRSISALQKFLPEQIEASGYLSATDATPQSNDEYITASGFSTTPDFAASSASPLLYTTSEENSPYTIMDSILWGDRRHGSVGSI